MERARRRRRVVITGLGAVTPIGIGGDGLWQGVRRGQSAVGRITRFDPTPFRSQVAAQVEDFEALDHFEHKQARRLDRFSQFALVSARQAIADAGLDLQRECSEAVGVYIGSALGGVAFAEEQHTVYMEQGLRSVSHALALSVFGGASSCNIAIELGMQGPNVANSNSCASGPIAIGEATRALRAGRADIILAGGCEVPLAPLTFGAFDLIRVLSSAHNANPATASRPFDVTRDGMVMAEGCGLVVLETLDHARQRGARIYAEVLGYGTTNDAYHMTAPLPSGEQAARAIRLALDDAALAAADIGYISAHGSSTILNDSTETLAVKRALGEHAYRIPMSSTKALHGHALGASGAIEAIICAQILGHAYLPPTVNLREPDPACDLDYIPHQGRLQQVDAILSNSFGFGGINAALIFGRVAEP